MTGTIFEKVRGAAADLFHLPPHQIGAEASPEHITAWDSVQHLNLILALENAFGLQFEPEEFERMKTIGEITALVESKLG